MYCELDNIKYSTLYYNHELAGTKSYYCQYLTILIKITHSFHRFLILALFQGFDDIYDSDENGIFALERLVEGETADSYNEPGNQLRYAEIISVEVV